MNMGKNDSLYKKVDVDRKLDWLIDLIEMDLIARLASSNEAAMMQEARSLDRMTSAREELKNEEQQLKLEEAIKEHEQAFNVYKNMNENYLRVYSKITDKVLPKIKAKYPAIAEVHHSKPVKLLKEEKPPAMVTCEKCKEQAVLVKDGHAACRIHYMEVFRPKEAKDSEIRQGEAKTAAPGPGKQVSSDGSRAS